MNKQKSSIITTANNFKITDCDVKFAIKSLQLLTFSYNDFLFLAITLGRRRLTKIRRRTTQSLSVQILSKREIKKKVIKSFNI
ncbi:Hypothetical protein SRAE_2000166000 [Strongyloides ratti]|uniref:Uncharacterized protein n=1 Tax=Strongyloides ratti TaxID=34506 RepID=A0A090LHK3_STRRB|nr:Hypothetical protein SRAE_2000166000 [Strongyloides ratti]CEF66995.1 Hypothetical protein SRAE_2000166000 [Strongyloides ratti]